jgi:hypothetical protein
MTAGTQCGICDTRLLRSGLCDYHLGEIIAHAKRYNCTHTEATTVLYNQAVDDQREVEEGNHATAGR